MAESNKAADPLAILPAAADVMKQIALKEAEKATAAMRETSAAEAEKRRCWDGSRNLPAFPTRKGSSAPPPSSGGPPPTA